MKIVLENDSNLLHPSVTNTRFSSIPSHRKMKQNLIEQAKGVMYDPQKNSFLSGLRQIGFCLLSGLV